LGASRAERRKAMETARRTRILAIQRRRFTRRTPKGNGDRHSWKCPLSHPPCASRAERRKAMETAGPRRWCRPGSTRASRAERRKAMETSPVPARPPLRPRGASRAERRKAMET